MIGSPSTLLNAITTRRGYAVQRSVPYGDGPRRTLDIYAPEAAECAPIIVFFYGGSWQGGAKETYLFAAATLARRGYVVIVPDYRLCPEVRYPAFLEDGAAAVGWAKRNAEKLGGDPQALFLMGHSAGAYNAAMLAIDERWLKGEGLSPKSDIAGLIGLSGPYDFLPLKDRKLIEIFGGANRPEMLPISYVTGDEPPALLLTGLLDSVVYPGNSKRLAAALKEAGSEVTLITMWNLGHLETVGALSSALRFVAPVLSHIDRFIGGRVCAAEPAEAYS